jgi:hypothetical protein
VQRGAKSPSSLRVYRAQVSRFSKVVSHFPVEPRTPVLRHSLGSAMRQTFQQDRGWYCSPERIEGPRTRSRMPMCQAEAISPPEKRIAHLLLGRSSTDSPFGLCELTETTNELVSGHWPNATITCVWASCAADMAGAAPQGRLRLQFRRLRPSEGSAQNQ